MKKILPAIMLGASMSFAVQVGVLGFGNTCATHHIEAGFIIDTEDNNNQTGIAAGDAHPKGFVYNKKVAYMTFCRMDASNLKKVPYDYFVLRLDNACPSGTYKFRRHHDTEDHNNANDHYGDVWPSVVTNNLDLEFCFVPATPGATNEFPLDNPNHGVFASWMSGTVTFSKIFIDDEDSNNANSFYWYGNESLIKSKVNKIVYDRENPKENKNTYYNVIRLITPTAKEAGVVDADIMAPADTKIAAGHPVAAEIKGFDHSAVTFELKSAGNVKVTIANLNGAVVSRVSRENLEPGIHSVEWHSGIVPNGRYVVTIEHNGKVSGKNVILK